MSTGLRIEQRSSCGNSEAFDDTFANLPKLINENEKRTKTASSAELWKQLLRYGQARKCDFWLAFDVNTGNPVARIGADVPHQRSWDGSIGFFECTDDADGKHAGAELIRCAQEWLKTHAAKNVYGPMDFNSWFSYRFKLREAGQLAEADKAWEPSAPDFYRKIFIDEGFTDDLQFASLSYEVPSKAHWQAYMQTLRAEHDAVTSKHGYSIRPFHSGSELLQDLRRIFELSNIAFADNPMFEVIPFEIFSAMTIAMARSTNIGPSRIVLSPAGDAVGFAFCFVDQGELVYKTVAVHPEHRSIGIANSLTYEISAYCVEHSLLKTTGALIRSGNTSEKIGRRHGNFAQPTKINQYSLLRKAL